MDNIVGKTKGFSWYPWSRESCHKGRVVQQLEEPRNEKSARKIFLQEKMR